MITGNQIRLGRFALRLSVQELSEKSEVSVRTIKRIEASDGVPQSSASAVNALRRCLEAAGIEFLGTPEDRPGIRIAKPPNASD